VVAVIGDEVSQKVVLQKVIVERTRAGCEKSYPRAMGSEEPRGKNSELRRRRGTGIVKFVAKLTSLMKRGAATRGSSTIN